MGLVASYGALVAVQAGLVLVPGRPRRIVASRLLGLAIPAAALVVGVALARTAGGATMGWLDFAAPALLGLLVARRRGAALATGLAGAAWGLLLFATSPIAATPPVLAGLAAGRWSLRSRKPTGRRAPATAST